MPEWLGVKSLGIMNHPSCRHGSVGILMIVDDFSGFRLEV